MAEAPRATPQDEQAIPVNSLDLQKNPARLRCCAHGERPCIWFMVTSVSLRRAKLCGTKSMEFRGRVMNESPLPRVKNRLWACALRSFPTSSAIGGWGTKEAFSTGIWRPFGSRVRVRTDQVRRLLRASALVLNCTTP